MATTDAVDDDPLPETFAEFVAPQWTEHALDRWDERMPAGAVAPETALERSVAVQDRARPLFQTGGHDVPDEVRLYGGQPGREAYLAVLVIEHRPTSDVVTCYRVTTRYDYSVRAYARARWQAECDSA